MKRSTRGRTAGSKDKDGAAAPAQDDDVFFTKTSAAGGRIQSRRKASPDAAVEEPQAKVPRKGTRRSTRTAPNADDDVLPASQTGSEVAEPRTNGATGRKAATKKGKAARSTRAATEDVSSHQDPPVASSKIALPMSDTPIINRNKEMRKKGGTTRRSSLGSRGRRASSLIENGQAAIPHREVNPAEFYKHIASDGLSEPRRMKQLLTWCGERSLVEKQPHGTREYGATLGGEYCECAMDEELLLTTSYSSRNSGWAAEGLWQPVRSLRLV